MQPTTNMPTPLGLRVPRDSRGEFESHIMGTQKYLGGSALLFLMDLAGSIQGIGAFALAFFTQFRNENLTHLAQEYLPCTGKILSDPFQCVLRAVNPEAEFNTFAKPGLRGEGEEELKGIFFHQFAHSFLDSAKQYSARNENMMCRVAGIGFAFVAASSRIVDLFIGAVAGFVSILSAGSFKELNGCAKLGLEGTGVIRDLAWAFAIICYADVSLLSTTPLPLRGENDTVL